MAEGVRSQVELKKAPATSREEVLRARKEAIDKAVKKKGAQVVYDEKVRASDKLGSKSRLSPSEEEEMDMLMGDMGYIETRYNVNVESIELPDTPRPGQKVDCTPSKDKPDIDPGLYGGEPELPDTPR